MRTVFFTFFKSFQSFGLGVRFNVTVTIRVTVKVRVRFQVYL